MPGDVTIRVDAPQVLKNHCLVVQVRGLRRFRWRLSLACWLIELAAWCAPVRILSVTAELGEAEADECDCEFCRWLRDEMEVE